MAEAEVISPFMDPRWRWSSKYDAWMCDNDEDITCPRCHSELPASKGKFPPIIQIDEDANIVGHLNIDRSPAIDIRVRPSRYYFVDLSTSDCSIYSFCNKIRLRRKQFQCRCTVFDHMTDEYSRRSNFMHFRPFVRYSQLGEFCKEMKATISIPPFDDDDSLLSDFVANMRLISSGCNHTWLQEFPELDVNEEFNMHTMLYDFLSTQFLKHGWNDRVISVLERVVGPNDDNSLGIRAPLLRKIRADVLKEANVARVKKGGKQVP